MQTRRKTRNLFGWARKSKLTYSASLSKKAYSAGQRAGDTGAFDSWLTGQRAGEMSAALRRQLESRFAAGVEAGEAKTERKEKKQAAADDRREKQQAAAEERRAAEEAKATAADIQEDYAHRVGERHRREGKRPAPGSTVTESARKALGITKAAQLARRAYMAGYEGATNPAVSAAQYRLAQAVLAGRLYSASTMTPEVAREIVERTPGRLRSEWSRPNPAACARTRKSKVSDRAKRYRANQPGCRPAGVKKCRLCGGRDDVMVDHIDGDESHGRKSNLRWLCRSCNTLIGAEMAREGVGRRTVQYNPKKKGKGHKGAETLHEYIQAVLHHKRHMHDAGGRTIHYTPKAKRQEYAAAIWAARQGSAASAEDAHADDAPDWVTNPVARVSVVKRGGFWAVIVQDRPAAVAPSVPRYHTAGVYESEAEARRFAAELGQRTNPETSYYSLAIFDGVSRLGGKQEFTAPTLQVAQEKAQSYADDMGYDAVLYDVAGRSLGRFQTQRAIYDGQRHEGPRPTDNPRRFFGARPGPGEPKQVAFTVDRRGKVIAYNMHGRGSGFETSPVRMSVDEAKMMLATGAAVQVPWHESSGSVYVAAPDKSVNPEPAEGEGPEYEQARKMAALFHGRAVKEVITIDENIKEHDYYWSIGPMVELKVRTLTKQTVVIPFRQDDAGRVSLFCSPDGLQFYLRGGDQELDLKAVGMGKGTAWYRDLMKIGEAKEITYRDAKKFHRFRLTDYYHKLGEETGDRPDLIYNSLAGKLSIVGGQYRVETKQLVDGMSPGIVN